VFFAGPGVDIRPIFEEFVQRSRVLLPAAILVLLAPLAATSGCSSSNQSTNPMPTLEPFNSGNVPNGGSFLHTFNTAGSFAYRCTIHSGMNGAVDVSASSANDSVLVAIGNNFFNPSPASVKPGGYVRWMNGGVTHTVTRP
jgi:plastocyanin